MRVLLTGGTGQLGQAIQRQWTGDELLAPSRAELDLTDGSAVWTAVTEARADLVVSCAAHTAVDACEDDPEPAWAVNAAGPALLAEACEASATPLVHVSTDYVFDGSLDRPYTEFDRPDPQSVYGRTKEAGEQLVRQACRAHQIVRTAWLQGTASFSTTILRLAAERDELHVVDDQLGTPTDVADLAPALRQLARTRRWGTFHLAGSGACTWFEYAEALVAAAGQAATVRPTTTAAFGARAPRPANSRLEGRHAAMVGLEPLPHWREALPRQVERAAGLRHPPRAGEH